MSYISIGKRKQNLIKMITEEQNKSKIAADYTPTEVKSVFLKKRQETMNLNGWGFTDSIFALENGQLTFTGNR